MSAITVGRQQAHGPGRRERVLGVLLAVIALVAALALLATNPRLLVALSSDRDGEALLPYATIAPGSSTSGDLVLANEGMLPLAYDLRVRAGDAEMASGITLHVRRLDQPGFLYQGPLTARAIPLGYLAPGQRARLEVILSAPPSQSTASVPVDDTFVWTAHSPGIDGWWWLILVAALLILAGVLMPRALALVVALRRLPPPPFELYWRAPLVLATVVLAMLAPLTGVSLSSVNAQTSNPGSLFAIGTVVLTDRAPSGRTCLAVGTANGVPGCDAIFQFERGVPGQKGAARVTIRNQGTVPIGAYTVAAPRLCATQDAPGEQFHGSADLCGHVGLTIHDDDHDRCYYPVSGPGACPDPSRGATLADFSRAYAPGRGLPLNPAGLGAGITYTFAVALDPDLTNEFQGRAPVIDFDWSVASPF